MPLVSVIIPTCNRAQFLSEAIKSVLKQTFRDLELIVVDDGSQDETRLIVQEFASKVRYFYQENKGVSAARNVGIRAARGQYVAFLDSDDLWKKRKLEIQMNYLQGDSSTNVCYTNEIWLKNGEHLNQKKKHQKFSGWILEKMLALCLISASSIIIHHAVFKQVGVFDEKLPVCEDYDLWLRIGARYPVTFIDKPLITKRGGHPDQLSHAYWGMDRFRVIALEKLLKNPDLKTAQRPAVIDELQHKCYVLASGATKRGKTDQAAFYQNIADKYKIN